MVDGYRLLSVPGEGAPFFAVPIYRRTLEREKDKQLDAMEMIAIIVEGILAGESMTQLQQRCDPGQLDYLYPAALACIPAVQSFVDDSFAVR